MLRTNAGRDRGIGAPVPEDLALVSHDDIEFAAAAAVPITSVRQPCHLVGSTAVELLLEELEGRGDRRRIVLGPELIVRESTIGPEPARL